MTGGEATGCATGKGQIGVGGDQAAWFGQFFEKKGFLGPVGATEGEEGVGILQLRTKENSRFLVKPPDRRAAQKGRAGKMDFFPELTQGGGRIEGGSGDFRTRPLMTRP